VRVPDVYAAATAEGDCPACVVLEWIDSATDADRRRAGERLGYALAELHGRSAPAYGLDYDNYCGASVQLNGWRDSWLEFYRERRIKPQVECAAHAGLLPHERRRRLDRLIERLDRWLDARPEPPSLLHGDLWGGNWLVDATGKPAIIDPAVYYGHREAELAMCHLFGGFPQSFFEAYDAVWPPLPGRDERLPLYQLYHLLNHLNIFGEGYGGQVDRLLQRYVG
jgi:fructosamine-3-kinase